MRARWSDRWSNPRRSHPPERLIVARSGPNASPGGAGPAADYRQTFKLTNDSVEAHRGLLAAVAEFRLLARPR